MTQKIHKTKKMKFDMFLFKQCIVLILVLRENGHQVPKYRKDKENHQTLMDRFDEIQRERIAALVQVILATKTIRDDRVPCQIEEGLYLGSLGAANNKSALKRFNITHILTVASSLSPAHPNEFTYKVVTVADRFDVNISQYFDDCFSFIDEAKETGGGVLIHCFAGRSRSVTIIVAYLMKKRGMRLSEALEHVKSKRPVACPNSGFLSQLEDFEKSLRDT